MSSRHPWTWPELCVIWDHPDWTAKELVEMLPGRTPKAIERARDRYGRWKSGRAPICWKCGERPVWTESPGAKRMGLCMSCYQDEERMREQDKRRNDALRQMRMRNRRRNG